MNNHICKVAPYLVLPTNLEANQVAMRTLQYCKEQLGQSAKQQTGLFCWDKADGNVILQTGETNEGLLVSLFLTSRAIRNFEQFRA